MDFHLFGADNAPAPLGLDSTHRGVGARPHISHAIAVRDLKEAVLGHYRPDLNRLKEDVVARVTRQGGLPLTKGV
jgi:hypothetical protein